MLETNGSVESKIVFTKREVINALMEPINSRYPGKYTQDNLVSLEDESDGRGGIRKLHVRAQLATEIEAKKPTPEREWIFELSDSPGVDAVIKYFDGEGWQIISQCRGGKWVSSQVLNL